MLRAISGAISLGETYWLIAAMRRNERIGPGIDMALVAGEGCACVGGVAVVESTLCARVF
jgi:hypothetical protein